MQPAPGRRALSGLASKLHPQLPLSKRQSENLLNLLTTSFRSHLDHEFPISVPERSSAKHVQAPPWKQARRNSTPARTDSSQSATSMHIEYILTNPLFATPPRRRGSNPSDPREVLGDPLSWFNTQIATGAADVRTAVVFLQMWKQAAARAQPGTSQGLNREKMPGLRVAKWLRYSGQDASREFVDGPLIKQLVPLLLEEGEINPIWRWFKHRSEKRVQETGLDATRVLGFRTEILRLMVASNLTSEPTIDAALRVFLRALHYMTMPEYGLTRKVLQPVGASLVRHILANPTTGVSPERYQAFLQSTNIWLGSFAAAIKSLLWLHHPNRPSAGPGLAYIQDPKGAATHIQGHVSSTRPQLLTQLCLEVAHQCLAEEDVAGAQIAINFTRDNFPDLVMKKVQPTDRLNEQHMAKVREQGSLRLLDTLVPG